MGPRTQLVSLLLSCAVMAAALRAPAQQRPQGPAPAPSGKAPAPSGKAQALANEVQAPADEAQAPADEAQALFDAALTLMSRGAYAPACRLLERSDHLDPGMGTRFRLAECYEKIGRTASAWALFVDVAESAKRARSPERERVARQRAAALEPRLARLSLELPPGVASLPGLVVQRNGRLLRRDAWATPMPLDPGEHTFFIGASGKVPWQRTVRVDRPGHTSVLQVPELADAGAPPGGGHRWTGQHIAAVAAAGVGGVGLVLGSVFAVKAASQESAVSRTCERPPCPPKHGAVTVEDDTSVTVAAVGLSVGAIGLGAGLLLWLTAPAPPAAGVSFQIAPLVEPGGRGVVVRGAF